jgi:hypothetical protein
MLANWLEDPLTLAVVVDPEQEGNADCFISDEAHNA